MGENGAGTKPVNMGLGMAGVIIVGLIAAGVYLGTGSDEPLVPEEAVAISSPAQSQTSENTTPDAPGQTADIETPGVAEGALSASIAPRIEEVRMEADGLTVIAGRAAPGAEISVLVDGLEIARAVADARGAFASVVFIEPSEAARVLTLESNEGGRTTIASAEDIILAPIARTQAQAAAETSADTERPVQEPASQNRPSGTEPANDTQMQVVAETDNAPTSTAQASSSSSLPATSAPPVSDDVIALSPGVTAPAPKPQTGVVAAPVGTVSAAENDTARLPSTAQGTASRNPSAESVAPPQTETVAVVTEPPAPQDAVSEGEDPNAGTAAVAVLQSTAEGVALLQGDVAPALSIGIDTIGYSDDGDVELTGRALPGSFEARVYLDNRFVSSLQVDTGGAWRGTVPDIDEGIYTLRVDEVNAAGDVTSRLETPFRREAPEALAEANADQTGPVNAITVQTGDTLWAIARDRYGEGTLFVRVFEANSASIRDPDLIYPGQVFDLPIE